MNQDRLAAMTKTELLELARATNLPGRSKMNKAQLVAALVAPEDSEFDELLDELLGLIAEDADALGCTKELAHVRHIVQRGTSAHRQLKTFELETANGADVDQALRAVVDRLIEDTTTGL